MEDGGAFGAYGKWRGYQLCKMRERHRYAKCTPPAPRKTSLRELLNFLHAQAQIGFPPTMDAEASPGTYCVAY